MLATLRPAVLVSVFFFILLGLALLIGAIYVVQREFRHLRMKDIGEALSAIPAHALAGEPLPPTTPVR